MRRWAHFSDCGRYRYEVGRQWDSGKSLVGWCLKNPSIANGEEDDPTLKRVIEFSKFWGYGGCIVTNPYAWVATEPKNVPQGSIAIGPKNAQYLRSLGLQSDIVVAGWGPKLPPRMLCWVGSCLSEPVYYLELTKCGQPKHPLYLRGDLRPKLWTPEEL